MRPRVWCGCSTSFCRRNRRRVRLALAATVAREVVGPLGLLLAGVGGWLWLAGWVR